MAKSTSFFGLRKGSTKTMTFSVLKGQQITKDRVTDIANPRTMDQTQQRIPFAQAVKFYRHATRNLFKFAYEDKKPQESDYNAFMRHNVKYASSVSVTNYRNDDFPSVGKYLMSYGSLVSPSVLVSGSSIDLVVASTSEDVTTVGGVSALILAHYDGLVEGDIVTIIGYTSEFNHTGITYDERPVSMMIIQFVLDTNSTTTLASLGLNDIDAESGDAYLSADLLGEETMGAGAVVFSRNTPSGLKVSTSFLEGSSEWNLYMTSNSSPVALDGNAYTWGAAQKAILQGSLSE